MSDTPRTDAVEAGLAQERSVAFITMRSHARQLERELALAEGKLAYLRSQRCGEMGEKLHRLEGENVLLTNVLNQARETLFVSLKGTPEDLQRSLGKLNLVCKAHWDWQTERMKK